MQHTENKKIGTSFQVPTSGMGFLKVVSDNELKVMPLGELGMVKLVRGVWGDTDGGNSRDWLLDKV